MRCCMCLQLQRIYAAASVCEHVHCTVIHMYSDAYVYTVVYSYSVYTLQR
jgi:hypothetical protein